MSNELLAVVLAAFYIMCSRKLDLCAGIILYYCACIITNAYTTGLRVESSPYWFYITQSLIDLAAIVFICYLSQFHKAAVIVYLTYATIIMPSMLLNGLMIVDQVSDSNVMYRYHLVYQSYSQIFDVFFSVIGSANVSRFIVRFLPFGRW